MFQKEEVRRVTEPGFEGLKKGVSNAASTGWWDAALYKAASLRLVPKQEASAL
jgi:hypothetical protein